EEARQRFAARSPLPPILVEWSADWHKGVVGVAAGRVAKEFHRPVVLLAVEGESATGSGRSLPGIELHGFLSPWKERMTRFRGHSARATSRPGRGGRTARPWSWWAGAGRSGWEICAAASRFWPASKATPIAAGRCCAWSIPGSREEFPSNPVECKRPWHAKPN